MTINSCVGGCAKLSDRVFRDYVQVLLESASLTHACRIKSPDTG
jgi:hypothetical protein